MKFGAQTEYGKLRKVLMHRPTEENRRVTPGNKDAYLFRDVVYWKEFVSLSIRHGLRIGKGNGPTNPMAWIYNQAERYAVLENVSKAVAMLEESDAFHRLVPELQVNIGMSLPYPQDTSDIVGIPGR